jgi:general secretion pathway protein N
MRLAPKIVLTVLFAAGVALGVLAIAPPTGLLDVWLNAATGGRVRLAQTEGTLWQGAARVVLVDPGRASRPDATLGPLPGLAMPGMLRWSLSPRLLFGLLEASFTLVDGGAPVHIIGSVMTGVRIDAGRFEWLGLALEGLGSPWNTVRPVAAMRLQWESLVIDAGGIRGTLALELADVTSAMSPVRPLGSWRLGVQATGRQAVLRMETLAGPVHLEGDGQWNAGGSLNLRLAAWPDPPMQAVLAPLLNLIGPREGGRTIIRVGA